MNKIKVLSYIYVGGGALAALFALLSECEILPTAYVESQPQTDYIISFVSMLAALGSIFIAHSVMNAKRTKQLIAQGDDSLALMHYCKVARCRLLVQMIGLLVCLVLYYAVLVLTSPMYCLIISVISYLFCKPSLREYESMRRTDEHVTKHRSDITL